MAGPKSGHDEECARRRPGLTVLGGEERPHSRRLFQRHCERSEAIQRQRCASALDCFVG
jgi:hypothetical protein